MSMDKASLIKNTNVSLFGQNLIRNRENSIFGISGDKPVINSNRQELYQSSASKREEFPGLASAAAARSSGDGHMTGE